jgi:hypothetical protein
VAKNIFTEFNRGQPRLEVCEQLQLSKLDAHGAINRVRRELARERFRFMESFNLQHQTRIGAMNLPSDFLLVPTCSIF